MPQSSSSSSSSPAAVCGVTLRTSEVAFADGSYAITLTVLSATCLDKELFVFQRKPRMALGVFDQFSHVASPADLEEYPVGQPTAAVPFFRLAQATLVFRELDLLMCSLQAAKKDICMLVETINQMDVLSECQFTVDGDGVTPCLPFQDVFIWDQSIWNSGVLWG